MYSQCCNVMHNAKCKPDTNDIDNITIKKMSGFDSYEIEWVGARNIIVYTCVNHYGFLLNLFINQRSDRNLS